SAVVAPPTDQTAPSHRAGLRDRIAAAIWERQNPGRRWADCEYRWRADAEADTDAVLAVLYRKWPWLRAEAEDAGTATDHTTPPAWVDGHPQLEAIAAAVWEQCGRSDNGACVDDDPRNIAVAALSAVRHTADAPDAGAAPPRPAGEAPDTTTARGCPPDCSCRAVCIGTLRPAAGARQDEPVVTVHAAPDLSPAAEDALGALIDVAKQQATEGWRGATEVISDAEVQRLAATGLVGYRQGRGQLLHCLHHKPVPASRWADFHEVTAEDLPDGGICVHPRCGADLLAVQPAAREDGGAQ